jgi:pimeloyl-ACP methyl ester carboxylesterase
MPYLDRAGVQIWYERHGHGRPVLLSHAYAATSEMWAGQIGSLSAEHELILWDMRGHGRSDSPDDPSVYSEDATVADMAAILDACGAETAAIGGLSMGGYMSLAFHLTHPERVAALLLLDTGPGFRNDAGRDEWNAVSERSAVKFEERGKMGLAHAGRGMSKQRDGRVMESLASIAVPTLVLVGENDKPFLGATDYMASRIPDATKVVIADAGHKSNRDQPEAFNQAVLEFLATAGW